MALNIRTVEPREFTELMRFLERCYGHSYDYFPTRYPHLYQANERCCSQSLIAEEDGRIVSHVAVFPVHVRICGVDLELGGVGGVATLPDARGSGYMGLLLDRAVDTMRERGVALSALGGDRQRYNAFGWEHVPDTLSLTLTRRSLSRAGVECVRLDEVPSAVAARNIIDLCELPVAHAVRPWLSTQLSRPGIRFFLADDGYAIVAGENHGRPAVLELVSRSGAEAGIVRSVLEITGTREATWALCAWDRERVERVLSAVSRWRTETRHMYRVIDLRRLMEDYKVFMENGLGPYSSWSAGITVADRAGEQAVTVRAESGRIKVSSQATGDVSISTDLCGLVRLLFGGPVALSVGGYPDVLRQVLPLPIHIPPLDSF